MSYNTVSETPGPRHRTARPHCSLRGRPLAISRRYIRRKSCRVPVNVTWMGDETFLDAAHYLRRCA